ncbi:MMPL family transporter [Streptomyces sp. AJS327]|uniref:MMPL family transporter n=1 Tax=Streptomyces sp. AJS327 TaxID=2545265 RepID=UPI0015DFB990|nr:MMPL family transporter [Streptomyces sp. AJS327]MBA0053846.1 MMPL family transporter [Streptomyces sp. AJS327]
MSARSAARRLATAPGGRRTKWLALGVWLIVLVALGPLAGKLGEVEDTSANAFLPRGAESAQVNTELERFRGDDEIMPAVIVYARDGKTTSADTASARADAEKFAPLLADGEKLSGPLPSQDGKALMVVIPLNAEDSIMDKVNELRDVAGANAPPGLSAEVGGPASSLLDSVEVFDSLDGTLMLATGTVVTILLLLTYRSPVLWLFPLLAVGFAAVLTQAATYLAAEYGGLPVDPQSAGILMVLVFGVGTDYALLLIARYREELYRHEDRHRAMRLALRHAGPAILASAGTVVVGLACLAFADINSSRSLGLVGALGVACAFLAMVTVLPALLVIAGRWTFWPFIPRVAAATSEEFVAPDTVRAGAPAPGSVRGGLPNSAGISDTRSTPAADGFRRPGGVEGVWFRIGRLIARRPRWAWLLSIGVTALLALSSTGISLGLTQEEMFQEKPESVVAQQHISEHYPSGSSDPATVVTRSEHRKAVIAAASGVEGVESAKAEDRTDDGELSTVSVVLTDAPDSDAAKDAVERLRTAVHAVDGAEALVGGTTAEALDTQRAADRDLTTVIPIVLLVVLLVLVALLRSLVAPLVLLATVVLSYCGALGASHLLFEHVFGFAAMDWSIPLMGFVFLVALGIDYNIFLMTRVREEAARRGHAAGVLHGLTATGGVITSAGVVLAATFAVFATLPLVTMAQLGVLIGVGVLLDTFLVRTVLVPALALDIGRHVWWPGALARRVHRSGSGDASAPEGGESGVNGAAADAAPDAPGQRNPARL